MPVSIVQGRQRVGLTNAPFNVTTRSSLPALADGFWHPRHSLTGAGSAKMASLQILSLMAFKVAGWPSTRFLDQHGTTNVSPHEWQGVRSPVYFIKP